MKVFNLNYSDISGGWAIPDLEVFAREHIRILDQVTSDEGGREIDKYSLDVINAKTKKPDSLYIEASKR